MNVLIVGFGNPLAGDDGAGYRAAELLAARLHRPEVRVLALRQLTPELAEETARASLVVFVDASIEIRPGAVDCCRIRPAAAAALFSHHLSPEALLELSHRLYGHCPEALLFTVGARSFTGPALSSEVEQALPSLVGQIEELIQRVVQAGRPAAPGDPPETESDFFSVMH